MNIEYFRNYYKNLLSKDYNLLYSLLISGYSLGGLHESVLVKLTINKDEFNISCGGSDLTYIVDNSESFINLESFIRICTKLNIEFILNGESKNE